MKSNAQFDALFMIVVIGNSATGKSCLLRKFISPEQQVEIASGHQTTVGVDFFTKYIDVQGQVVKLQVWDTAGQERFRSITSAYYRGAQGAIICYDCQDKDSFEATRSWINEFRSKNTIIAPILVAATKHDTYDPDSEHSVSLELAESLA